MYTKLSHVFQLLLAVLLLSACTNKPSNPILKKDNSNHLHIGVMSSMDYLPLAVAQGQGLFEKEGVVVTIHKFYSANERDAAFQSKNLEGTIIDYTGAAIQRAGGVKLKLTSQCESMFVMVGYTPSGISEVSDLVGKKVAVSRNTVIDYCTDLALETFGISPDSIERVEINKIPLRLEMLRSGKIDATLLPDPFASIAYNDQSRNLEYILGMEMNVTGIAFYESVIEKKREAIQNFYKAYNQAVDYIKADFRSSLDHFLVSEIGFPEDLAPNAVIPEYQLAQPPVEDDLKSVEEWLKKKDLVPSNFDINTCVEVGLTP
ncbi:MAG: MetQ/NlpA family ABC transporter substrate-binding protein [Dysgonamonadaceae bacterium]|nr:MetQ/NlpA family ABC transporter substrate-binding protein [Dysgonamonadaceae bacterium]MDD4728505.1 MetQ/NlpA family ABC transporter substrate-binding protein [Dysgonamonadaceae bacterium]